MPGPLTHPFEYRSFLDEALRAESGDDNQMIIEGYASKYNRSAPFRWSRMLRWVELVRPGTFDRSIALRAESNHQDIRGLDYHRPQFPLGRISKGTLELDQRADGLFYRVHLNPKDPNAVSAFAKVERGDYDGSSFFGRITGDKWHKRSEDMPDARAVDGWKGRELHEVNLKEVSVCAFPVYGDTDARVARSVDAAIRSYCDFAEVDYSAVRSALEDGERSLEFDAIVEKVERSDSASTTPTDTDGPARTTLSVAKARKRLGTLSK